MALTDNIVAYWKLDEVSGNRADSAGSNTLTDNNTVASISGKIGLAAEFVKANTEYLSCADNAALSTGDIDFSMACWCQFDDKVASHVMSQKGWDDAYGEWLFLYDSGNDRFEFLIANAAASVAANTFGVPSIATWYYVAAGYNATLNELWISVNAGTPNTASYSGGNTSTPGTFKMGLAFGTYYDGRIDEHGIWKRDIRADVAALYNSGAGLTYPFGSTFTPRFNKPILQAVKRSNSF